MKKERKKNLHLGSRANYIFYKQYIVKGLIKDILKVEKKWKLPLDLKNTTKLSNLLGDSNIKEKDIPKVVNKLRDQFINKIGLNKYKQEYLKDVKDILFIYGLGKEWISPIADFMITQWIDFPDSMLFLEDLEMCKEEKSIIISLGPHSTLDDIKYNWQAIEEMKKALWPDIKCERVSINKMDNLIMFITDMVSEGMRRDLKEKKQTDYEKIIEYWQYREGKSNQDISRSADKKRVNILRQTRRRFTKEMKKSRDLKNDI